MKWRGLVAAACGYALGLVPTAQIVGRYASRGRVDVTVAGSGNPGAANVARLVGPRAGGVVFAGDAGKGLLSGVIGRWLLGPVGAHVGSAAALVAHCHPITRPGGGGKGVSTGIGQVFVSFPAYLPVGAAVAGGTYYAPGLDRDARLATTVATITWVLCALIWRRRRWPNLWGPEPTAALPLAAAVSAGTVLLRFHLTRPSSEGAGVTPIRG